MPKYELDDKGILTITSEHDGGIFTVRDVFKKMSLIVLILSVVLCVAAYIFFYHDSPTTGIANNYCSNYIEELDCVPQIHSIMENYGTVYDSNLVATKMETQCDYYVGSFKEMHSRSVSLIEQIRNQIEAFRKKWR